MTEVFLDTNIFFHEKFLRSTLAEAVLKGAKLVGITVFIPEVVIDEAKNNFALQLQEKITKYNESRKDLGNFIDLSYASIGLDNQLTRYKKFLDNLEKQGEIIILPYPEVSPRNIVLTSYARKKPFKSNGKGEGYKDYLIWQTIKEHCEANPDSGQRFFITKDKDFCEHLDDGKFILHPELAASLEGVKEVPIILGSLNEFFNQALKPLLEGVRQKNIHPFTVEKIVTNILKDNLPERQVYGFQDLPFITELVLGDVVGTPIINEIYPYKVEEDGIFINIRGEVPIEVYGYMDVATYYNSAHKGISLIEQVNDHDMAVSTSIDTPFELILSYSIKDKKVFSYTINFPNEVKWGSHM